MRSQRLKGLARVRKHPATGKTVYCCYAWRGGLLLRGLDGQLQPDDPALANAYHHAHEERRRPHPNTMDGLVSAYRSSTDFKSKVQSTRREYDRYLDEIRATFGKLTFEDLESKATRGRFKAWRDTMADRPRTADYAWSTLSHLLSFGKDRGLLSVNLAERGGRLYHADRRDKIWTDAEVEAFLAASPRRLRLAMQLALWTGQRKGDLLALKWSAHSNGTIRLRQSKTGARVAVPVARQLRIELDAAPRTAETIMATSRGEA